MKRTGKQNLSDDQVQLVVDQIIKKYRLALNPVPHQKKGYSHTRRREFELERLDIAIKDLSPDTKELFERLNLDIAPALELITKAIRYASKLNKPRLDKNWLRELNSQRDEPSSDTTRRQQNAEPIWVKNPLSLKRSLLEKQRLLMALGDLYTATKGKAPTVDDDEFLTFVDGYLPDDIAVTRRSLNKVVRKYAEPIITINEQDVSE